jgi:hypothetical protein
LSKEFKPYLVHIATHLPLNLHLSATSRNAVPAEAYAWFEEELGKLLRTWQGQRLTIRNQQQQGQPKQHQRIGDAARANFGAYGAEASKAGAACTADGVLAADFFDELMSKQGFPIVDCVGDLPLEEEGRPAKVLAMILTWVACGATLLPNLCRGWTAELKCFATAASLCGGSLSRYFPALDLLLREGEETEGLPVSCVVVTPLGFKMYMLVSAA